MWPETSMILLLISMQNMKPTIGPLDCPKYFMKYVQKGLLNFLIYYLAAQHGKVHTFKFSAFDLVFYNSKKI